MVPQQQRRRRRRAAIPRASERRLVVARGVGGFGFTIAGQRPCVVSAVATGGPAERAGLRAGDALLAVDGANVARAPHASVARLVAGAPGAISLSVSPRDSPPTDTEDTEPDERSRTRRRHQPPRRRPQPSLHHPGWHAAAGTSGVNEILQNLSRAQLAPRDAARLECRAVVAYLGTIDTPRAAPPAAPPAAPAAVRSAVRKLRQERRPAPPVLLAVLPDSLLLRRPAGRLLAQYRRDRIVYAGCGSDADRRYFGLVTAAESGDADASLGCHVFAVDPRMAEHAEHAARAHEFQIACTLDPVAERCLEFPPSAEYVVGVIRGMYSLPAEGAASPALPRISRLALKADSPAAGDFGRCDAAYRARGRPLRDSRPAGAELAASSPQPSTHSEITTASSNSDSGIGFHNDGRHVADRILVVEFAGAPPPPAGFRADAPRRPLGLVGCGSFDADGSFLSNTTPVVDGFGGQGRPLNLDDVLLPAGELRPARRRSPRREDDTYNYNDVPSGSRYHGGGGGGGGYEAACAAGEGLPCEFGPSQLEMDLEMDRIAETFNSVEIYEECRAAWREAGADSVSLCSSRSHEAARPLRRHLQASLDDMLVLARRDQPNNDDDNFVHPAAVKCKIRKSTKPLNLLSKTRNMLTGKDRAREKDRRRAVSASAGDVTDAVTSESVAAAASEPDLRDTQSEQSSPFRRWTTGSGSGSSYRHHDHRNMYNKQMSEGTSPVCSSSSSSNVARWSLGLDHLLADPAGAAAFAHFLTKEFAAENINFWFSCEQYRSADAAGRATLAEQIWARHLAAGADEAVNVDAAARRHAALLLCQHPPPADLFLQAQKQIFNVMKFDSYPRFLRSATHAECARADLRGLPPPYAPAPPDQHPTNNNLKKSASNVSERRRSGGAKLLQRLRPPSRDRQQASVTDVVKSSQPTSLCRVMLPDNATTVVSVDSDVTVGQLVDKLLQRRNLPCSTYDVLWKEPTQGETSSIDLQSSSTVLSGREALVSLRAVVRLQLPFDAHPSHPSHPSQSHDSQAREARENRWVTVRCGATRRLEHVLRRVGSRYQLRRMAATRDGVRVHADTLMQELDGCRLQIVEECENELRAGPHCERDSDVDSLSELALRLQDERDLDTQSNSTSSSLSTGGRVRAALRPGAALHHHPPDFLDNLRETQRLRLTKDAPCPRTPPPLPPKPPLRSPTVV